jgi:hypothetical protein
MEPSVNRSELSANAINMADEDWYKGSLEDMYYSPSRCPPQKTRPLDQIPSSRDKFLPRGIGFIQGISHFCREALEGERLLKKMQSSMEHPVAHNEILRVP